MTLVTKFSLLFVKLFPLAYLIMFKNDIEGGAYVKLLNSKTVSIWIGTLNLFWPPLLKKSILTSLDLRNIQTFSIKKKVFFFKKHTV